MQSQDSISRDRTTPSVAEPRPGTPERARLRISAPAEPSDIDPHNVSIPAPAE